LIEITIVVLVIGLLAAGKPAERSAPYAPARRPGADIPTLGTLFTMRRHLAMARNLRWLSAREASRPG